MRIRYALPLLLLLGACADRPTVRPPDRPTEVVDSIFPPEEELRRFQASLPDTVHALTGGAPSRDELVARFVAALEAADSTAFAPLALTTAEFGWLWFPGSRFTRPPYRTKPGLLWFQLQNASSRGINRAFRRFGGQPLGFEGYACPDDPVVEGENRTWEECTVTIRPAGADSARTLRLYGGILERGGVWKFVGYENDL
jgi:hypothetical protein